MRSIRAHLPILRKCMGKIFVAERGRTDIQHRRTTNHRSILSSYYIREAYEEKPVCVCIGSRVIFTYVRVCGMLEKGRAHTMAPRCGACHARLAVVGDKVRLSTSIFLMAIERGMKTVRHASASISSARSHARVRKQTILPPFWGRVFRLRVTWHLSKRVFG